jgi:outer membrane protein assembly factor BamB
MSVERSIEDLVFVGLNRRVIALDRYAGHVVWDWKAPRGSGFPAILLDGDRLIVGVAGYAYCLDPVFGQVVWENPLKGYGSGVMSLVSVRGRSASEEPAEVVRRQQAAAAAAAAGGGAAVG